MALNKSKGNMYGFINFTVNFIKGECEYNCSYCYMGKYKLSPSHLDEALFKKSLPKNANIFVGSSIDMFSPNIPNEWIEKVLNHLAVSQNDDMFGGVANTFLFQTKNVKRLFDFTFPKNSIFCTTIETDNEELLSQVSKAPPLSERKLIKEFSPKHITIEPVMKFSKNFANLILELEPDQVNIGANSRTDIQLQEPRKDDLEYLINKLERGTKVYLKDNLRRLM